MIETPMTNTEFRRHLKRLGACPEGRAWVGRRDLATAWAECERADHMLWLAGHAGVDRSVLVHAAADCAETALQYVPEGEERPRKAIEAARRWADDPSEDNRRAVWGAAWDADDAAAMAAARAAARAAWTAWGSAGAAAAAADAAADTAADAGGDPADAHRQMCELVRARITADMVQAALRRQEG